MCAALVLGTIPPFTENADLANDGAKLADPILPEEYFNGFPTEITHDGRNSNGCSLDRRKCRLPDQRAVWRSSNMLEVDEAYTCRVLGFKSVEEMYRWISCEELLNQIDDLPTLLVNSLDDPCVVERCHVIPKAFAGTCYTVEASSHNLHNIQQPLPLFVNDIHGLFTLHH